MSIAREDLHGLLLIRDSLDADGGFLLGHILKLLLGLDGRHFVLLVALKHTPAHYTLVFRKLGLNATSLAASGRVVLIDALRPVRGQPEELLELRMLHRAIGEASAKVASSGAPVAIIFDDLTVSGSSAWLNLFLNELTRFPS